MKSHAAPVVALALGAFLPAQTSWTLLTPPLEPPAYTAHAMAFFLPTASTILFGGSVNGTRSSDTWSFDGATWTQLAPATVPTARVAHSMVYDFARARLVMFGGLSDTGTTLGDVWEWDGVDWTDVTPAGGPAPSPRWAHCMCYDVTRAATLVFGGYSGGNVNDLWSWDGVAWTQIVTANSPSTRRATAMEWDPNTANVILFAGYQQPADTWMFDGFDWTQLSPATLPPARYDHAMATDLARGRIVMFGGQTADTWEWDGVDWIDRTNTSQPSQRQDTYLAYDWIREEVQMFGSVATPETWRYASDVPATFTVLGAPSCPGSNGLPVQVASADRPWLGDVFSITLSQLPSNGIALMVSGLSDTAWSLGPLPAPLDTIGMTGCVLQVEPVILDVLLAFGTTAQWNLAIPDTASLLGQVFYSQGGALDPGANAFGVTVGNYGRSLIGGK